MHLGQITSESVVLVAPMGDLQGELDLLVLSIGYLWVQLYLLLYLESLETSWQKSGSDGKARGMMCM